MSNITVEKGVLDESYALNRLKSLQFIFRYRVRAKIVEIAARRYLAAGRPLRIVDFGAADGLTLREVRSLLPAGTYIGVEWSAELLQSAGNLPADMRMVQDNVMHLSSHIKDKTFDVVCALAVLEHLSDPLSAVREAARVLCPGGIFVATCPLPAWDAISQRLGLLRSGQHETKINQATITAFIRRSGMQLLSYEKFMSAPIGILPYFKIRVSPDFALKFDKNIRVIRIFDWLFVNQCVIARKPLRN